MGLLKGSRIDKCIFNLNKINKSFVNEIYTKNKLKGKNKKCQTYYLLKKKWKPRN